LRERVTDFAVASVKHIAELDYNGVSATPDWSPESILRENSPKLKGHYRLLHVPMYVSDCRHQKILYSVKRSFHRNPLDISSAH
jgi:hypothetical protein